MKISMPGDGVFLLPSGAVLAIVALWLRRQLDETLEAGDPGAERGWLI